MATESTQPMWREHPVASEPVFVGFVQDTPRDCRAFLEVQAC